MCGVAGVLLRSEPPDAATVDRLAAALAHRGPDGQGTHVEGSAAMAHTRLAIIDLETGDQPLFGDGATLIANGEIYNYVELRHELGEDQFKTKSDCEPPLKLFLQHGANFSAGLRGMYAIGIVEAGGARAHLSRDPFGIKPLYYTELADGVAFASEPQALFQAGLIEPRLNTAKRAELLQLQFTTGRETIYQGVDRVLPGETLTIENGYIAGRRRRAALAVRKAENWTEEDALVHLDRALMNSVEVHQRADVPYGMFLSGGVDSSAILACMRDLNAQPVEAFTVGFSETGVADERKLAKTVAAAAGANFTDVEFSEDDFWTLLPEIAAALDDPTADYAVLPTYKLGKLARDHGLKVVLSGEGGDELFAGYGRYRRALRHPFLGGRPMRRRGILHGLGVLRSPLAGWRDGYEASERTIATGFSRLQSLQAIDCADWLPNDLLIKLDRCLMAHGVEGRTPFLDPVVADIAMRLPDNLKIKDGQGKYLLRKWLAKKLPEAEPFTPKRGFTVPVAEWIGRKGKRIGALVARQDCIAEICLPEKVESLFSTCRKGHQGQAAWTLLFYALWHKRHIDRIASSGDVFETLS